MANSIGSSVLPKQTLHPVVAPNPHRWTAARVAGTYLIAGLLWIVVSDLSLALSGGLTSNGLRLSAAKGVVFVLLSTGFVFWLCRREYRNVHQSMELLRAVVEGTSDAVFVKDRDGKYLLLNSAGAQFIGKPVSEVLGRDDRELFDAPHGERLVAKDREIMDGGRVVTVEETLTSAGITRTYQATKAPYFNPNGAFAGLIGISRNVTDRAQVEAALRESDARLREAQRIARLGSWSWEPPTNRVLWSDAQYELLGIDPATMNPSFDAFLALLHPDDRKVAIERVDAMLSGATEFADDLRVVRGDGSFMWIHSQARATRDANGVLVRVEGTDQDITAQRSAREAVEESERRLRLALEAAGAIAFVWEIPEDKVIRYFSKEPALPATAEYIGTLDEVRMRIYPDDLNNFDKRLSNCLASGSEYRNEYRVVRPNGTIACLEEYGYLDRASDGSPLCLTGMSIDVTDRVTATESLRTSEERLRVALKGAKGGVWDWNLSTGIAWWSPEMYQLMGACPGEDTGDPAVFELIHEDDRQRVRNAVADAIARGEDYHCEFRVKNGGWLSSHALLSYDAAGKPDRLVGITWDVTDRVNADEALRLSESRYRQLIDILPTAILVHADNVIRFVNPAFVRLMGAENEISMLGQSPFQVVHPSSHNLLRLRQEALAGTRQPLPGCEMLGLRCDGRPIPLHVVAAPIEGYGNGATLVALSDLTERERSAALLRSVLDSVDAAILTVDDLGNVTSINQSTERLFGYCLADLSGKSVNHLVPELDEKILGRTIEGPLHPLAIQSSGIGREVKCRRKVGTEFPAELTVTEFLRDGQREFTWVLRDITARRQLEEQFRQAQKMEAVGRLAGGVAHDFNNLLTVINGYSELLLADHSSDASLLEPLAAIHDAGDRAARLTKQLLALSRKSMVEPRLVDLNTLVAESAKLFGRLIGENINLLVLADSLPVHVVIDPGQLEQVLMNLVVNARDAMPTGGRLTIETRNIEFGVDMAISDAPSGRYAMLRVTDTGMGIRSDIRDKIFEPFFTTKGVGKGTGLGLAVVHGVVQQSGGTILVETENGFGTTFKVLFPADNEDVQDATPGEPQANLRGGETVLIVEDEEAVRGLVKFTLEGQGYTVLTASTGIDALPLIRENPGTVHLMVTDMIMPGINGRELAEEARKIVPDLRVIFMSGYTDDILDRYSLHGTSDQFIQKPFTPLGLVRKVRGMLDQNG